MDKPVEMLQDDREISMINDDMGGRNVAVVGQRGVTRIVCYGEPSHYSARPYFAIYKGDFLSERIDAAGLTVYYAETPATRKGKER